MMNPRFGMATLEIDCTKNTRDLKKRAEKVALIRSELENHSVVRRMKDSVTISYKEDYPYLTDFSEYCDTITLSFTDKDGQNHSQSFEKYKTFRNLTDKQIKKLIGQITKDLKDVAMAYSLFEEARLS